MEKKTNAPPKELLLEYVNIIFGDNETNRITKREKKIISEYEPIEGYFDLSRRPDSMGLKHYASLIECQKYVSEYWNSFKKNGCKFPAPADKIYHEKIKEYAADIQMIIFYYWGDGIFGS